MSFIWRLHYIQLLLWQDPVLFGGTVRYNLDPFNDYPEQQLWSTLEQVSSNKLYILSRFLLVFGK